MNGLNATLILVLASVLASVAGFQNRNFLNRCMLNPFKIIRNNEWYRVIASGFVHADWMHLLLNVFVLYTFGGVVEEYFSYYFEGKSQAYFFLLYGTGIAASSISSIVKFKNTEGYNSLGASGAVSAVLFAFILFDPGRKICLYGILCLPGIIFGIAYLGYSWYATRKKADHINHDAHFWGAVWGILFVLFLRPETGLEFLEMMKGILSIV